MIAMPLPLPSSISNPVPKKGIRVVFKNGEYVWYKVNGKLITEKNYNLELWVHHLNSLKSKHHEILKYEIINL